MITITMNEEQDAVEVISENITLVITHNDVGLSIDAYEKGNDQPVKETQYWFDDFKSKEESEYIQPATHTKY